MGMSLLRLLLLWKLSKGGSKVIPVPVIQEMLVGDVEQLYVSEIKEWGETS